MGVLLKMCLGVWIVCLFDTQVMSTPRRHLGYADVDLAEPPLNGPNHFGCVCQQTCSSPEGNLSALAAQNDEILQLLKGRSPFIETGPEGHGQEMRMIFRASAGSGVTSLYELWMSNMTMNENNPRLLTADTNVKGVYKSPLVEQWNSIEQVKVVLYSSGREAFHMFFNAENTDKVTWFTAANLRSSSYHDIVTASKVFFSIEGYLGRRFYVQHRHGGCDRDSGWFTIIDVNSDDGGRDVCPWGQLSSPSERSQFLYSSGSRTTSNNNMSRGDVLIFYAKLKASG